MAVHDGLARLPGVSAVEVEESAGETRARILCLPGADPREDVFRLAVENGWVLRELAREALTLEDVFVRLTRHDEVAAAPRRAGGARVRKLFAIVGREWRAYFLSPLAYVILTAFMFLNGIIFSRIVAFLSAPGAPHERFLALMFTNTYFWIFTLFIVPILTMRLLAEERRSGTLEVLLTSPVSETTVVVGKFLGAFGFYVVLWAPSALFILFLRAKTSVDLGAAASGYVGIALMGAYFLAIGTFASSLTKNQILAAILTFAILIPVFSVGLFESGADPARQSLIGYLNIWDHMDEFARGIVDTRRIVYYLSGTAFFLLLAATILASKKETP